MNNFDLRRIHELMSFDDVCSTDNEYMREARNLPVIKLAAEPLYVIATNKSTLFTPKLRYYQLWIEREVNQHLNASIDLLQTDGSEALTAFILKKTREAVQTLANDANKKLILIDPDDKRWQNLTSANPDYGGPDKDVNEQVVVMHYLIAELIRCWLELQDRYARHNDTAGLFDIPLCYSSFVGRMPDCAFELKQFGDEQKAVEINLETKNHKGTTKKKKSVNKDNKAHPYTLSYFTPENDKKYNSQKKRVIYLFQKLTEWKWISKSTRPDDFAGLFEGKERYCNIKWEGNAVILTSLMTKLLEQDYIKKQTRCSARSLVLNQFGKNTDNNYDRISDTDKDKIAIVIIILDISKPLPEKRNASGFSTEGDLDLRDAALLEVYGGVLRSTKGI